MLKEAQSPNAPCRHTAKGASSPSKPSSSYSNRERGRRSIRGQLGRGRLRLKRQRPRERAPQGRLQPHRLPAAPAGRPLPLLPLLPPPPPLLLRTPQCAPAFFPTPCLLAVFQPSYLLLCTSLCAGPECVRACACVSACVCMRACAHVCVRLLVGIAGVHVRAGACLCLGRCMAGAAVALVGMR